MSEYRSVSGELKLLENSTDFIFPVELWMLNDSVNRNNWQFVNLEEHRADWAGVPILVAYVNGGRTVGDGHNQQTKRDRDGTEYQSFVAADAERIVGAISDNPDDIRLEERDENTWIVGKGFLWAWYAQELVTKITEDARQGSAMSVSIEALVTESHMNGDVEVEESYIPLGVTLLGDGVMPAVADAHIAMLSEIGDEFKELKLRAASYMENSADKPQKITKKGVKHSMRFSKQQLRELQAKFGDAYTVLAAEQTDGGVIVCLMTQSGETAIYTMASADESVVLERVQTVNAQAHFCAEGCDDVLVDACDMVMVRSEECAELTNRVATLEADLTEARNTITAMRDAENKRRVQAAKSKATATLSAFNANREIKIDEKMLENINKDIEGGKYTTCADENGEWTGEQLVEEKVLSICAAAVMEQDKKNAAREPMTWGSVRQASAAPGTIGELFASKK